MFDKDKMRREMSKRAWKRHVNELFSDENHFFTLDDWNERGFENDG